MEREMTFNWTNLRATGLVGFEGEDLGIEGVRHEGNLVHVDLSVVPGSFEPVENFRWVKARSIYGTEVWFAPRSN